LIVSIFPLHIKGIEEVLKILGARWIAKIGGKETYTNDFNRSKWSATSGYLRSEDIVVPSLLDVHFIQIETL